MFGYEKYCVCMCVWVCAVKSYSTSDTSALCILSLKKRGTTPFRSKNFEDGLMPILCRVFSAFSDYLELC